jgi:hypothetical protein
MFERCLNPDGGYDVSNFLIFYEQVKSDEVVFNPQSEDRISIPWSGHTAPVVTWAR